jgi:DNA-binding transcriptional LysR family regulator
MSLLNYTHLRAFRAVAAEGNLTRAAEKLGVAQSAVSTQIKALEARLGHALFERRGRSMALTEAGRIAFDCAERAFAAGDELVETLAGRAKRGAGGARRRARHPVAELPAEFPAAAGAGPQRVGDPALGLHR